MSQQRRRRTAADIAIQQIHDMKQTRNMRLTRPSGSCTRAQEGPGQSLFRSQFQWARGTASRVSMAGGWNRGHLCLSQPPERLQKMMKPPAGAGAEE